MIRFIKTNQPLMKVWSFVALFLLLASCSKDDAAETPQNFIPQFLYAGNVYKGNTYNTLNKNAILVQNDSVIYLSPQNRSDAQAVFGNGKDIFVAGYQHNGSDNRRIVSWTNNSTNIQYLSTANKYNNARAILEDQGKMYVSGTEYLVESGKNLPFQRLWVNGQVKVNQGTLDFSGIEAITTYNGEFFLAGQFAQAACIWYQQSMRTIRTAASNATYIKKTATDTIALGYGNIDANSDALIAWKNGKIDFSHTLNQRVTNVLASMQGNDYYFVTLPSISDPIPPKVFKNNTLLYEIATGKNVRIVALQVYRNKVYVLGNLIEGTQSIPTLWVDGKPQTLFAASKNIFLNDFYIAETEGK